MKNSHSLLWLLSLLVMMCIYSCKDNSPKHRDNSEVVHHDVLYGRGVHGE